MGMVFVDRESAYPNRYLMTTESGESQYVIMERADEPVTPGTALNAETFNGLINEVNDYSNNAAKKAAYTRNLLDNSDFRNPINQRGLQQNNFLIDRWRYTNLDTATQNNNSITIKTLTQFGYIEQRLTNMAGKTITFAIKANSVNISKIRIMTMNKQTTLADGKTKTGEVIHLTTTTIPNDINDISVMFYPGFVADGGEAAIYWAALYEGEYTEDTLPNYVYKGYAAELLECRKYYQRINPGYIPFGFGWSNTTTPTAIRVTLPCSPMRIQPTVTFKGTLSNVRLQFNQGAVNITSVDGTHYKAEAEYISIFMKPGSVYVGPFVAYCISDGEVFELSADL